MSSHKEKVETGVRLFTIQRYLGKRQVSERGKAIIKFVTSLTNNFPETQNDKDLDLRTKEKHKIKNSWDLNTGRVRYSNGINVSDHIIVRIPNVKMFGIQIPTVN